MNGATQAFASARSTMVLATDGGVHSPGEWAKVTAVGIMHIDETLSARDPDRYQQALTLRAAAAQALFPCFRAVKPAITHTDLLDAADNARAAIEKAAAGTPWAHWFTQPDVRRDIALTIFRNLSTAADLALRTE